MGDRDLPPEASTSPARSRRPPRWSIDIAQRIDPSTRFFYLDTDLLFEQTYTTRDALAARYGIEFDRFHNIGVEEQARHVRR